MSSTQSTLVVKSITGHNRYMKDLAELIAAIEGKHETMTVDYFTTVVRINPDASPEIVFIELFNKVPRKFIFPKMCQVREIHVTMKGKSCDFESFPQGLEALSTKKITPAICEVLPQTLRTLCTKYIEDFCCLPEKLERLLCIFPPDELPSKLTHLIYSGNLAGRTPIVPESVKYLCCSKNEPENYPKNLEVLRVPRCELVSDLFLIDLSVMCQELKVLVIGGLPGGVSNLANICHRPTIPCNMDDVFSIPPPFPPQDRDSLDELANINLPSSLTELHIGVSLKRQARLLINYHELCNLEILTCPYNKEDIYPSSIKSLALDVRMDSSLFTNRDEASTFVNKIKNSRIDCLALPLIHGVLFDMFCTDSDIVRRLFLSFPNNSKPYVNQVEYLKAMNYEFGYDLSMIKSQLVINHLSIGARPTFSDVLCVNRDHCTIEDNTVRMSYYGTRYTHIRDAEILDMFGNPMCVSYMSARDA